MKDGKKILHLALPAMVENILQMLMGVVDNYLVAQLGLIAVSGVSVANNILAVYQALFIALGAAVSSLIAKSIGAGERKRVIEKQNEALVLTLILGLVLGLISLLFGSNLLQLLGTEEAVSRVGGLYLAIVGGGIVSLGLLTTLSGILRSSGKVRMPMYLSLISNAVNALLSAIAIYWLKWGIVGVAIATVFSRLLAVGIMLTQLDWTSLIQRWRWSVSREFIALTLPTAGERLMMRAGDVVIIAIIVLFGTEAVAGNAIGETITQFNYMPGMGVATATIILTAHARGQNDVKQIRKVINSSYIIAIFLMFLISLSVLLVGEGLAGLFTSNPFALEASQVVLLYSFLGTPATAGTLVLTAAWQGLGNAKLPFYATTFGMWGIRLVIGYVVGVTMGLGLAGVWIATVLDNVFRSLFLYIKYQLLMKELEG